MRQYEEAKAGHPDAILFFRLGDFYEMFHEDAVVASRLLNLTLTSRNKGAVDEVPMAGVPYHAAHGYIAKLLAQGFKVALCEQMADPSKVKGIVPRQVVRVVTPGLVTDSDQLDARANHYLLAIDRDGDEETNRYAFALLDLSTGELAAAPLDDAASLMAELARADPREVLLAPGMDELEAALGTVAPRAVLRSDQPLADADIDSVLEEAEVGLAAAARREHGVAALRASARLLRFSRRCIPGAPIPVRRVVPYDPSGTLRIDEAAQVHLELVRSAEGTRKGSLLEVIDATVTPVG